MISTVLFTVMLATKLFYLTGLFSFIGCYFENLSLSPLDICGVYLKRFKEFRDFWPFSFTSLLVIVIDNFWKFSGAAICLMSRAGIFLLGWKNIR